MPSRAIVDSVSRVAGPPQQLEQLEAQLTSLRNVHRGAIIERYLQHVPAIAQDVYIAPGAAVVGRVALARGVSIWMGCVLRGDVSSIEIRERTNVQDGTVIHLGDDDPTFVAEDVVIGHRAVVHGCRVGGGTLVGIQATILNGAVIGEGSIIGSCALVTAGTQIPPRSLVLGVPGKVVRTLTAADEGHHRQLAGKYTRLAHNYRCG